MLTQLNKKYDDWLDRIICTHPTRLIVAILSIWLSVAVIITGIIVHYTVTQSLQVQMDLHEYRYRTIQTQQQANQHDLNYLGDELFRMRKMQQWPSR